MSTATKVIDSKGQQFIDLADRLWNNPEIAYKEVNACKWTAEYMKEQGFTVETGAYDMPTCMVAKWGEGHPVIGFLGEYDALPGMSQKITHEKDPVLLGGAGQGCGHNLLGVACLGAAIGMKAEMEEKGLKGTIIFYGCPAEEVLTGKAFMARNGAFRELDVAFSWHGGNANVLSSGTMTGLNSAIFHFKGRTAHAGGDPHNGRSALDAAELMSVGAQYLREHVTSDVRIHYVYKEAGTAPNIVPDRAAVWYYVRAMSREAVESTYERLVKIAKGAAMMTETEVEIEFLGGCYNTMNNMVLANLTHEALQNVDAPQWTAEELAFADKLNKQSPMYEGMNAKNAFENGPIAVGVAPIVKADSFGSTDVGDVMHICPTVFVSTATWNLAAPGHSWQITACSGMSIGHKGMLYGAKAMAAAGIKLVEDPTIVQNAKAEFDKSMNGRTYKCPIPAEVPVPQP